MRGFYESDPIVNGKNPSFAALRSTAASRSRIKSPDASSFYTRSSILVPGGAGWPGAQQVDSMRMAQSRAAHFQCKPEGGLLPISTSRTHPISQSSFGRPPQALPRSNLAAGLIGQARIKVAIVSPDCESPSEHPSSQRHNSHGSAASIY